MTSFPAIAAMTPTRVVIVLFPRTKLLDVTGPLQVFNDAKHPDGSRVYEITLASEHGGPVETDAGLPLPSVTLAEATAQPIDTLLVSGGRSALEAADSEALLDFLRDQSGMVRRLGSICLGAFILAAAGLLDGCEATTHWEYAERLGAAHPATTVTPDAIFVSNGRIWTSAGVSTGIDMALAMIEEDLGRKAALDLARDLVLYLKRPGGQSQFSGELQRQSRDAAGRFETLHAHMREHAAGDLSVPELARIMAMSPRHFARIYAQETGISPAKAVEAVRLDLARDLLEESTLPIQQIAVRAGFGDDERLRRAFLRRYGVAPGEYRTRFGNARTG
ncbi:GlxA family transcriptional regulator [Boseaceae bacterium BT-24-1]|nr:GlxA family transcriptional regulator [Boseaceae bacterium BT-24-1]